MMSPARRHKHAAIAAQNAKGATAGRARPMPEDGAGASEYRLLLAALGIHLNQLRQIQSTERKIEAKREMIGDYRTWVEAAADAEAGTQDEIVSTMLVWAIDLQDWDLALKLARYVLKFGISLPERYNRTPATLIAEEIAEAEIAAPGTVPQEILGAIADLVEGEDIFDQVRAKLEKALGLSYQHRADTFDATAESGVAGGKRALFSAALGHFERAVSLDKRSGVKKLIEKIGRALKPKPGEETPAEETPAE